MLPQCPALLPFCSVKAYFDYGCAYVNNHFLAISEHDTFSLLARCWLYTRAAHCFAWRAIVSDSEALQRRPSYRWLSLAMQRNATRSLMETSSCSLSLLYFGQINDDDDDDDDEQ